MTSSAAPSGPVEVVLAPGSFDLDSPGGPVLFLLGVVVMVALVWLLFTASAPPTFGVTGWLTRGRH